MNTLNCAGILLNIDFFLIIFIIILSTISE